MRQLTKQQVLDATVHSMNALELLDVLKARPIRMLRRVGDAVFSLAVKSAVQEDGGMVFVVFEGGSTIRVDGRYRFMEDKEP